VPAISPVDPAAPVCKPEPLAICHSTEGPAVGYAARMHIHAASEAHEGRLFEINTMVRSRKLR